MSVLPAIERVKGGDTSFVHTCRSDGSRLYEECKDAASGERVRMHSSGEANARVRASSERASDVCLRHLGGAPRLFINLSIIFMSSGLIAPAIACTSAGENFTLEFTPVKFLIAWFVAIFTPDVAW